MSKEERIKLIENIIALAEKAKSETDERRIRQLLKVISLDTAQFVI